MPLVSIIVPVYSVEVYLPKCIESILSQTLQDFELILVDDCSPDHCGAICDEYAEKDARIQVIHQQNGGVANARNTALDRATGRYIAFCDSDDTIDCVFLKTLVDILERNGSDSVVSSFLHIFPDGSVTQGRILQNGCTHFHSLHERFNYIANQILWRKVGWEVWTRLFRRSIIERHHIRFCENCGNFAEDLGFVLQYSFYSSGEATVNYHGYRYIHRNGSMMDNSKTMIKIDQINMVSKYVFPSFCEVFPLHFSSHMYNLIHAVILYDQLNRIPSPNLQPAISALSSVQDMTFLKKHLKGIHWHYKTLEMMCGKRHACRIILFSHFCRHQNYFLFRVEHSFINRMIVCID